MSPNIYFYDADGEQIWVWHCQYLTEPLPYHEAVREHESCWGVDVAVDYSKFLFASHPGRYDDVCNAIIDFEQSCSVAQFCDAYKAIIDDMRANARCWVPFQQRIVIEDLNNPDWECEMEVFAENDDTFFSD